MIGTRYVGNEWMEESGKKTVLGSSVALSRDASSWGKIQLTC